jgi:hypothetical protein
MYATATVVPTNTSALPLPTTSLAEAALSYAEMGWSIFRLAPRSKSPIKGSHSFKDATSDVAVVEQWWQETPNANIGLATGAITVLDVDPRNGGHLTLADLEAKHGPLPYTVESQTGNYGRHLFFQCPDMPIRTGTNALGPGLDIKGDGGYVVLPPSR